MNSTPKTKPQFLSMYGSESIPAPKAVDIRVNVDPLRDPGVIAEKALLYHFLSTKNHEVSLNFYLSCTIDTISYCHREVQFLLLMIGQKSYRLLKDR